MTWKGERQPCGADAVLSSFVSFFQGCLVLMRVLRLSGSLAVVTSLRRGLFHLLGARCGEFSSGLLEGCRFLTGVGRGLLGGVGLAYGQQRRPGPFAQRSLTVRYLT